MKKNSVLPGAPAEGTPFGLLYDGQMKNTTMRIAIVLLIQMYSIQGVATVIMFIQQIFYRFLLPEAACILGNSLYGIGYFLAFFIPAKIFGLMSRNKPGYQELVYRGRLPRRMPLILFAVIAVNFIAAYINSYVLTLIFPTLQSAMESVQEAPMEWYEIMMQFFTVAIVPAICEEILFRGVVLKNLLPYGRTVAILGSGLLFGLMHCNPLQLFYTATLGVVLGYVYVKTRSLFACMFIHFCNNSISVIQLALVNRSPLADKIAVGLEMFVIVSGAICLSFLLWRENKKVRPEDTGSFGVVYESQADFAEYPVTRAKRIALFFSPIMIVYLALVATTMLTTLLTYGMIGFLI